MDETRHLALSDKQSLVYNVETLYTSNGPPTIGDPTDSDHAALRWTSSHGSYGLPTPSPRRGGSEGAHLAFAFAFDPSAPPPGLGYPPPGHFLNMPLPPPLNTSDVTFQTFSQQFRPANTPYSTDLRRKQQHNENDNFLENESPNYCLVIPSGSKDQSPEDVDGVALRRKQDQQWLRGFLQGRMPPQRHQQRHCSGSGLRHAVQRAAHIVSKLQQSCQNLRKNTDNECTWTDSYVQTLSLKRELQDQMAVLDTWSSDRCKSTLSRIAKRKVRRQRARRLRQIAEKQEEQRRIGKETAIDTWRMEQIRQVEEKNKEQELKLAADAVLCEVRKKQADMKRMHDVLRSLEKLRRLRKEAASRRGIVTEAEYELVFSSGLEQLKGVLKRRTAVYSSEEKALMVMLEGEQEEERKREHERRIKKDGERLLHKKQTVDTMLFGGELPADSALQPFTEYYTQAERSLQALLQIRKEWDVFVVAANHPDSSSVPQSWIVPDVPSDQAWASALHTD